jgi:hypothetical protein
MGFKLRRFEMTLKKRTIEGLERELRKYSEQLYKLKASKSRDDTEALVKRVRIQETLRTIEQVKERIIITKKNWK